MLLNGSFTTCLPDNTIESVGVDINSYHVKLRWIDRTIGRVTENSAVLYQRGPMAETEWLDDSHVKITTALRALEIALQEAVGIFVVDDHYTKKVSD